MTARTTHVAILDDDHAVRNALSRLLRLADMLVTSYATASEFFDSLVVKIPDCLLLDLQMRETTGLDVLRTLKLQQVAIPTIIITAHDGENSRLACLEAGAIGYMGKPVDTDRLIQMIVKVCGAGRPAHRAPRD